MTHWDIHEQGTLRTQFILSGHDSNENDTCTIIEMKHALAWIFAALSFPREYPYVRASCPSPTDESSEAIGPPTFHN